MSTSTGQSSPPHAAATHLAPAPEMVNLSIDGKQLSVPKGTNVVQAAKSIGVEIPHYCYHPHLSVAGNCRMCQVRVKGAPKMDIACNLQVKEGMEVETHHTNKDVANSQAAILEFILINHPLDCTVCDQAGHCKLQDYHFNYNARPSRFLEEKEHKVKAVPLGETVMLDGERCIMCTRCIRFCDEVTGTSELGMLNRGDRSVIAVHPGKELSNPLSGSVVDLCPVGALTHKKWRFNTRIWFTDQTDSICPGCSTGCNVKVAARDGKIVHVKGRLNSEVNKEWLCDEGRYGFERFLPKSRVVGATIQKEKASLEAALKECKRLSQGSTLILLSPDLLLEEFWIIHLLLESGNFKNAKAVLAYKERELTEVEKILISPDYAANFQGSVFCGVSGGNLTAAYQQAIAELREGKWQNVIVVGDAAIGKEDLTSETFKAIARTSCSVAVLTDAESPLLSSVQIAFGARSVLEKSGLIINRKERLQYASRVIDFPEGTEPHWRLLNRIGEVLGGKVTGAITDRELTVSYLSQESRLAGLTIPFIKRGGVDLRSYRPGISEVRLSDTKGAA